MQRVPAFIISLPGDEKSFAVIREQLDALAFFDIVKVDGVIGASLPDGLCLALTRDPNSVNNKGAIGCFLAHVRAWEHIQKLDADYALVLEDDARSTALQHLREAALPRGADIVFCTPQTVKSESAADDAPHLTFHPIAESIARIDTVTRSPGSYCYLLTPPGARKLLQATKEDLYFSHVDVRLVAYCIDGQELSRVASGGPFCELLASINRHTRRGGYLVGYTSFPALVEHDFTLASRRLRTDDEGVDNPPGMEEPDSPPLAEGVSATPLRPASAVPRGLPARNAEDDAQLIRELYACLLQREPEPEEVEDWTGQLATGLSDRELVYCFLESEEYRAKSRVRPAFSMGHVHSPIVDPEEARKHVHGEPGAIDPERLPGLSLSLARMRDFWVANAESVKRTPFEKAAGGRTRYFYENDVFPIGDAALLRLMVLGHRPRRIIDIGTDFSLAAALDSVDEAGLDTRICCIETDPPRPFALMRAEDWARIDFIRSVVQDVPLSTFGELGPGDMLIIDSTHVLKTGSDVNYELFSILPALGPGVLIHFHDVFYPFEYGDEWVYERNFSWNEVYALRAFLMYNDAYRIEFFNDLFAGRCRDLVERTYPTFLYNSGGSLWLSKTGARSLSAQERVEAPAERIDAV